MELRCIIEKNANVNIFYCLWCKGKYPKEKKNPNVTLKFLHIVMSFLNDLDKGMRRQKPKSHGCSLQIPCEIQTVM